MLLFNTDKTESETGIMLFTSISSPLRLEETVHRNLSILTLALVVTWSIIFSVNTHSLEDLNIQVFVQCCPVDI